MPSRITPEIRRLSECSFTEALQIWNEGFKGYRVDMTMTMDAYLSRLHWLFLSPELSLVAFHEGRPVGFLLNGVREEVREHTGRKIAWNGGTGVSPEFRGAGIGKALVKAALDLYREQAVSVAMLEAIRENERAINLYQTFGYEIVDRLIFFKHDDAVVFPKTAEEYSVRTATPLEVGQLDFYQESTPWQTQWQTLTRNHGEALLVMDRTGAAVGYALYQKQFDLHGVLTGIAMHQCGVRNGHADAEAIGICALRSVYAPLDEACYRTTNNFSAANVVICRLLEEAGFTIFAEQVHMMIQLD